MNDTNIETFMALNEASAGGYVHSNMNHINEIIYGNSYDKRSFYPSIMISEKFPSSLFEKTEDLDFDFNDYCYLYHFLQSMETNKELEYIIYIFIMLNLNAK